MVMATFLDCVNGVLRRIREDEVVTVIQSDYSKLIGDMVNEAKREVEDAWNWSVLRTTKTITTVSGTQNYEIPTTNPRARLLVVYIPSLKRDLQQATQNQMHEWNNLQGSVNGDPFYFSIGNSTSSTGVDRRAHAWHTRSERPPDAAHPRTLAGCRPRTGHTRTHCVWRR